MTSLVLNCVAGLVLAFGTATTSESDRGSTSVLGPILDRIEPPNIVTPEWAEMPAVRATYTYRVATRGHVVGDLSTFREEAHATLSDPRGWRRAGIVFQRVEGAADFTLYLSAAPSVPSFGPPCHRAFSCRSGDHVIINQDRWLGASTAWNDTDASLEDYRHMVVNHEVGHWLGFGHSTCRRGGAKAPVMQQQSKSLYGCTPNSWPLDSEIDRWRSP